MAELNDPAFPSKRKSDSDAQHLPAKSPKFASFDHHETQEPNSNDNTPQLPSTTNCSSEPKEGANNDNQLQNDNDDEKQLNDNDEDEDEDEDEVEDEEEEEHELDRKGKGVMRDDKGKGKLIEEEEDDDDDDSDDDDSDDNGSGSGDDSDFSDDPLAEVDLNNILPSRTRRQTAHSGVRIAGDTMNAAAGEDDDDSDDSDA